MDRMIRVVAPADLKEGYTFDVMIGDQAMTVTVPEGGVSKDEAFEIPYPSDNDDDESSITIKETQTDQDSDEFGTPMGRWRNHLCGCCDVVTQSTFWMAICCAPVLVAQLVTRLGLNWKGNQDTPEEASLAYNKIVLSFVFVLVAGNMVPAAGFGIMLLFGLFLLLWTGVNIRKHMRARYRIPGSRCPPEPLQDCCCMLVCGCCSIIQMARHTHDDHEFPGYCCTTTGLEIEAPSIV